MAAFFQPNFFQNNFYQVAVPAGVTTITDTSILQLPINCVMAGDQLIKDRYRTFEIHPQRRRTKRRVSKTAVKRLSQDAPSFTVTTSKKGYD